MQQDSLYCDINSKAVSGGGAVRIHPADGHPIKILCFLIPQNLMPQKGDGSAYKMDSFSAVVQRSLGIPPSNKKMGCLTHQPSMCSAWLGHAQLTALSSWKPWLDLTVLCSFYRSQEGGQVPCSPAASCMLPLLAHLHEEPLRSEKTSRASPSPPSRKLQTVAYGQLSSP